MPPRLPRARKARRRVTRCTLGGVSPLDYLSPLFALLMVGVLVLISRWVFAPNIRGSRKDYGLLVPVVTITAKADAEAVRDRLQAAGLRATLGASHAITHVSGAGIRHHPTGPATTCWCSRRTWNGRRACCRPSGG